MDIQKFSAIIFDMDGVLIDSEGFWNTVDEKFLSQYFPEFPLEKTSLFLGKGHSGVYRILSEHGFTMDFEEFHQIRTDLSLEMVYQKADITPGVLLFLKKVHPQFSLAIGTSNRKKAVDVIFDRHDIRSYFPVVVTADDVNGNAKPAPDIFLLAAKKMGVLPRDCLVLEDAPSGIQAGKAAGMTVFGFRGKYNQDQDLSSADKIFDDFITLVDD